MDLIILTNTLVFDTVSIVALAIILINAIDGLRKGFALTLLNFIGLIVVFGGSMLLAQRRCCRNSYNQQWPEHQ